LLGVDDDRRAVAAQTLDPGIHITGAGHAKTEVKRSTVPSYRTRRQPLLAW
jgi:hypothetical protein